MNDVFVFIELPRFTGSTSFPILPRSLDVFSSHIIFSLNFVCQFSEILARILRI